MKRFYVCKQWTPSPWTWHLLHLDGHKIVLSQIAIYISMLTLSQLNSCTFTLSHSLLNHSAQKRDAVGTINLKMNKVMVPTDSRSKVLFTAACYLSNFVAGAVNSSLWQLFVRFGYGSSSAQNMGYSMLAKSIALILGYVINGLIFQKVNKRIGLIVALLLLPLPVFAIASDARGTLQILFHCSLGFILSMFEVSVNSLVLDTWTGTKKSPGVFLALQVFYGVGFSVSTWSGRYFDSVIHDGHLRGFVPYATVTSFLVIPIVISFLFQATLFYLETRKLTSVQTPSTQPVVSNLMYHSRTHNGLVTVIPLDNLSVFKPPNVQVQQQPEPRVTWMSFVTSGFILFMFAGLEQGFYLYLPRLAMALDYERIATISVSLFAMTLSSLFAEILAIIFCIYVSTSKLSVVSLSLAFAALPFLYWLNSSTTFIYIGSVLMGLAVGTFPHLVLLTMDQRKHLTVLAVGLLFFAKHAGSIVTALLVSIDSSNVKTVHTIYAVISLLITSTTLVLFLVKIR